MYKDIERTMDDAGNTVEVGDTVYYLTDVDFKTVGRKIEIEPSRMALGAVFRIMKAENGDTLSIGIKREDGGEHFFSGDAGTGWRGQFYKVKAFHDEAWIKIAQESNRAIHEYLRSVDPSLPEDYGMPVDGVRRVIEKLLGKTPTPTLRRWVFWGKTVMGERMMVEVEAELEEQACQWADLRYPGVSWQYHELGDLAKVSVIK